MTRNVGTYVACFTSSSVSAAALGAVPQDVEQCPVTSHGRFERTRRVSHDWAKLANTTGRTAPVIRLRAQEAAPGAGEVAQIGQRATDALALIQLASTVECLDRAMLPSHMRDGLRPLSHLASVLRGALSRIDALAKEGIVASTTLAALKEKVLSASV